MKRTITILAALLAVSLTSVGNAQADQAKQALAFWYAEVQHMATICGSKTLDNAALLEFLASGGVSEADLSSDGPVRRAFIVGTVSASDKYAEMSISSICYHLDVMFGEDGAVIKGAVR